MVLTQQNKLCIRQSRAQRFRARPTQPGVLYADPRTILLESALWAFAVAPLAKARMDKSTTRALPMFITRLRAFDENYKPARQFAKAQTIRSDRDNCYCALNVWLLPQRAETSAALRGYFLAM